MDNIFGLDLETKSTDANNPQYALEPWRAKQGKAVVTSCAVVGPNNYAVNQVNPTSGWFVDNLRFLAGTGRPVFCHNALFDVAWELIYANDFQLICSVNWQDTGLLAKWLLNSQMTEFSQFAWSLQALCEYMMPDHPRLHEFTEMKSENHVAGAKESEDYWLRRGVFDAEMTRDLAIVLRRKLPVEQRSGYDIERQIIPYVTRAWMNGMPLDREYIQSLPPKISAALKKISSNMPISGSVVTSPTQLSDYLFETCGLKPKKRGKPSAKRPLGAGSTAAGDLKMLRIEQGNTPMGKLLDNVLGYKQVATLQTKYVNGFERVMAYTGEAHMYPSPRIFGTYTGRFTYGSKTKKKQLWQYSIACHQLPKVGPTKKCLPVPEGKWTLKCDGDQQELRLIAEIAPDQNLINEFNSGVDVHSAMSAFIANENYDMFMHALSIDDPVAKNYRMAGKLLNLSCQYRIGAKALMTKFFETYDIVISMNQAYFYLNLYKQRYPGVVDYWVSIALLAQERGYTTSFADRRYYIHEFDTNRWGSESSAINEPIQGSAADHKELTLLLMSKKYPEAEFFLDIHDEVCFYVPQDMEFVKAFAHDIKRLTPEYRRYWNRDLKLELSFGTVLCKENFKEGVEVNV